MSRRRCGLSALSLALACSSFASLAFAGAPNIPDAAAKLKALEKARPNQKTPGVLRLIAAELPLKGESLLTPPPAKDNGEGALLSKFRTENPDAGLLENESQRQAIETQRIQAEVRNELEKARGAMAGNPTQVKEDLKLLKSRVSLAADLMADVRSQLNSQIETMLRETDRRRIEKESRELESQQKLAGLKTLQQLDNQLNRQQEREKQLMDRFNSLMDEGRAANDLTKFVEASEVAVEARNVDPTGTVALQALTFSYFAHDILLQTQIRDASIRGFMDEMASVEKAHIPFNDNMPIVYPSAQAWQTLTAARKKYQAVDVKERGPAEQKILDELDKPSKVEFIETPLKEVMEFISEQHGINIQFDEAGLKEAGFGSDTPVPNVNLKGISLRSILRLILRPLKLTYVIKDEVLLITTQEAANTMLVTKVYPVADLVLPINNGAGANPFAMGGGLGGQGAFGGGLGGGQQNNAGGGAGGGGFGGGGGGFGGGGGGAAFNLPDLQRFNRR